MVTRIQLCFMWNKKERIAPLQLLVWSGHWKPETGWCWCCCRCGGAWGRFALLPVPLYRRRDAHWNTPSPSGQSDGCGQKADGSFSSLPNGTRVPLSWDTPPPSSPSHILQEQHCPHPFPRVTASSVMTSPLITTSRAPRAPEENKLKLFFSLLQSSYFKHLLWV